MLQFFGPARTKLIYNYIDRTAGTEQWGQQIARPAVLQPRRPGQEQGNMEWLWFDVRNIESYIESYQFYISYPVDIYSASQCRRIDSDWYRSWVIWSQPLASCLPLLSAAGHTAGFWSSKPICSGFWARLRPSESLERGRRGTVLPLTCSLFIEASMSQGWSSQCKPSNAQSVRLSSFLKHFDQSLWHYISTTCCLLARTSSMTR